MKKIRIGGGAGYSGDRIEPALDIMQKGDIDYIIFECLAERTIALAQQQKLVDPDKGFNELLEYRMEKVLPICTEKQVKVITNMGAANPLSAARLVKDLAVRLGITDLKIAAVLGDDIFTDIDEYENFTTLEYGNKLSEIHGEIISANVYLGAEGIQQALQNGADIVITGRVTDPSLVIGPLLYEFGWETDDYDMLGKATLAGHLLECGAQVTGGYFAEPGYKDVPDLWNVGFPIGEVFGNGDIIITKLTGTGGKVTTETVKEQILYEIHDPSNYMTPDVNADFSQVTVKEIEPDKVLITGATGKEKSGYYKTSIGYKDCYIVEAEISYGGSGALERARLAGDIVKKRIQHTDLSFQELKIDHIGVNSLFHTNVSDLSGKEPSYNEVRLRVAGRTTLKEEAIKIGNEVEALYTNGPAGGGGVRISVNEIVSIASILIPAENIETKITYEEV
ncbi:acyclic terpene utilization AtuA family protein [Bacillus sp. Marseille-Q3570]|uniref:acyclic terpene utilization AtuA family protein n=1 Tax=Bacillus sp. Marseille-Q3570 TaxID=2963522 RepID=UPI0021B70B62|nr:acyclic terpene utilization AtuA family protein [Bacillus sp. Marseille-Q3570]